MGDVLCDCLNELARRRWAQLSTENGVLLMELSNMRRSAYGPAGVARCVFGSACGGLNGGGTGWMIGPCRRSAAEVVDVC